MRGDTQKINRAIERIKESDIHGCITGSSMTGENFDDWASTPDIDVFVYGRYELMYAVGYLIGTGEFEYKSSGEKTKVEWLRDGSSNKKYQLDTVKLVSDGIELNITYKRGCSSLLNVLSSFDMTIIMVGYDIQRRVFVDLRTGSGAEDPELRWPVSKRIAYPNPMLLVHDTVFDVAYATRQFDRVMKYWDRGFDTRPMARFYINKIDSVIEKGAEFKTEKSIDIYNQFVEEQTAMKEKIQMWLGDKEDI